MELMLYRKDVTELLRRGCRIHEEQEEYVSVFKRLARDGFIEIERGVQAYCKNPEDYDYWDVPDNCKGVVLFPEGEEEATCPDCGRIVYLADKREKQGYFSIQEVNYSKIEKRLLEIAKCFYEIRTEGKGLIRCSLESKCCYIVLIHIVEDPLVFSSLFRKENRIIYVYLDSVLQIGQVGPFDCSMSFLDILDEPVVVIDKIKALLNLKEPTLKKLQSTMSFVKYLGKYDKDGRFCEKEVVPEFLDRLRVGHKQLRQYLDFLAVNKNNLLGQLVISVGANYNIDERCINRYEYIQGLLEDKSIVDSKAFSGNTTFNVAEFDKICRQLRDDPINPERAVIIVFNDRVSVWNELIKYRELEGYWKIIVINASLLSELIVVIDAIDWLESKVRELQESIPDSLKK